MKILVSILLWLPVIALKIVLVIAGLLLVRFTSASSGLYRAGPNRPWTWKERAIRNPVGGFDYLISHPDDHSTFGTENPEPSSQGARFAWRFRIAGILSSIRLVWRYSKKNYGELYLGWKIGSAPPRLDFALSLRPWADIGN